MGTKSMYEPRASKITDAKATLPLDMFNKFPISFTIKHKSYMSIEVSKLSLKTSSNKPDVVVVQFDF